MNSHQLVSLALLTVLSVTYSVGVGRLERLRLAVAAREVPNLLGVWTFAATVVLSWPLLIAFVLGLYAVEWPTFRRAGAQLHRHAFNAIAVVVSCCGARLVLDTVGRDVPGVGCAVLVFTGLNIAIVASAICWSRQFQVLRMLADPVAHLTDLSTQLLGALLAAVMVWHEPIAAIFVPVMLYGLHLVVTVRQVHRENAFDETTGLWREDAWRVQVAEIVNRGKHIAIIVIDPDDAQRDHLIAAAMTILRPTDLKGRLGGRQVVAASLAGAPIGGEAICRRLRLRLDQLGVRCTIGCATAADADAQTLLDRALLDVLAKRDSPGVLDPQ